MFKASVTRDEGLGLYDPETRREFKTGFLRETFKELVSPGVLLAPIASLLKRDVLKTAAKAATQTRKGLGGESRTQFDGAARRLFESIKALPEKVFEPLEEVRFPRELIVGDYGKVRGVVSPKSMKMEVALSPEHKASISKTLFHEMTHVGQAVERKAGDPAALLMRKAREELSKRKIPKGVTSIGWARKQWKMDPAEQHAEELGGRLAGVLGRRLEKGEKLRITPEQYKKAFREALPRKYKGALPEAIKKVIGGDDPSPRIILPKFSNTEEAIAFGQKHIGSEQVARALGVARLKSVEKVAFIKKNMAKSPERFQLQMDEAIKGQFFREALEELQVKFPHVKKGAGKLLPEANIIPKKTTALREFKEGKPVLISSTPKGSQLYIEFDNRLGTIPDVQTIKNYAKTQGFDVSVTKYKGGLQSELTLGGIRDTTRYRVDVWKEGRLSSEAAIKLSKEFGGRFSNLSAKILGKR